VELRPPYSTYFVSTLAFRYIPVLISTFAQGAIHFSLSLSLFRQLYRLIGVDVGKEALEQGLPLGNSFYTIALNPDVQFMLNQARSALAFTPYLKIKLDANIEQGNEPPTGSTRVRASFLSSNLSSV
jgi:hypothetical protein